MKKSKHPLFGEVFEPNSISELMETIVTINVEDKHSTPPNIRMWRGQSDLSWPIHSAAYRRLKLAGGEVNEKIMYSYEEDLINQAKHRGHDYLGHRTLNELEVLARLQHFGTATRLIDASRNAFVALYFAISEFSNIPGLLVGINVWYCGGNEGAGYFTSYADAMKKLDQHNYPQTWELSVITPRIAAQHSQFLYSSVSASPMGSLALSMDPPGAVVFIAISPKMKLELSNVLRNSFDIYQLTLFPDIEGFSIGNSYKTPQEKMHRW